MSKVISDPVNISRQELFKAEIELAAYTYGYSPKGLIRVLNYILAGYEERGELPELLICKRSPTAYLSDHNRVVLARLDKIKPERFIEE